MANVYVSRQPIFDRHFGVLGYEVCSQRDPVGEQAEPQAMLSTLMEIGIERLVGERLAFFDLTGALLPGRIELPFPPERVVIEVDCSTPTDPQLLEGALALVRDGYRVALDHVAHDAKLAPLLELATYAKVEASAFEPEELSAQALRLRAHGVRLVAERVDTHETLERCVDLGFDYFQGFVLSEPNVVAGRRLPIERLARLQTLARVNQPDTGFDELRGLVRQNVALTYRVLRWVNSAASGVPRRVDSVDQALVLLGERRLRNWLTLMLLADIEGTPQELMVTAMVRAKTCERLAVATGKGAPDACFTVGLLSVLDPIMKAPMADVLAALPLSARLAGALLQHTGPEGELLGWAIAWERDDWEALVEPLLAGVPVGVAYLDGLAWSLEAAL